MPGAFFKLGPGKVLPFNPPPPPPPPLDGPDFALKRMLDLRGLRKSVLFRLFDALILPVAAYGSQV